MVGGIDHQIRQDGGHQTGMRKVGFAGLADLAFVGRFRKLPGFFHKFVSVSRMVFLNPVQHLVQRHGFIGCKSHFRTPFLR